MRILCFFILAVCFKIALGQPVITSSVYPSIGESYIIDNYIANLFSDGFPFNPHPTGENIIWDLEESDEIIVNYDGSGDTIVGVPAEEMCVSEFYPTASMALRTDYFEGHSYDAVVLNTLEYTKLGDVYCEDFEPEYSVYDNPLTLFKFPLEYGDSYTDDFVLGDSYGHLEAQVIAYGTMIFPFMTIPNVLAVQCDMERYYIVDGDTISKFTDERVYFFNSFTKGEILSYTYQSNNVDYHVDWYELNQHIIPDAASNINEPGSHKLLIYPNPNNGVFEINNGDIKNNYSISISSLDGRIIYEDYLKEGINKINPPDISSGLYLLSLRSADNQENVILEVTK